MSQGLSYPLAGSSFKLTILNRNLSLDLLCHSLHRTTFAVKYNGFTLVRMSFLTSGGFLLGSDQTGNESLVPSVRFILF